MLGGHVWFAVRYKRKSGAIKPLVIWMRSIDIDTRQIDIKGHNNIFLISRTHSKLP